MNPDIKRELASTFAGDVTVILNAELNVSANFSGKIENSDGIYWYKNGVLHREDGPAMEYKMPHAGGVAEHWFYEGMRHREDGPAIVYPCSTKKWYYKDCLCRFDGPAIEFYGKSDIAEWWIKDRFLNHIVKKFYLRWLENNGMDVNSLSSQDKEFIFTLWNLDDIKI